MTIKQALVAYLNARAGLVAVVGSRIYPQLVPEGAANYPAVTYQLIGEVSEVALDGMAGLSTARIQLTAWARTYAQCDAIDGLLKNSLSGYRGDMGDLFIQACLYENGGDMPEDAGMAEPGTESAQVYGKWLDYKLSYAEPIPTYA